MNAGQILKLGESYESCPLGTFKIKCDFGVSGESIDSYRKKDRKPKGRITYFMKWSGMMDEARNRSGCNINIEKEQGDCSLY